MSPFGYFGNTITEVRKIDLEVSNNMEKQLKFIMHSIKQFLGKEKLTEKQSLGYTTR